MADKLQGRQMQGCKQKEKSDLKHAYVMLKSEPADNSGSTTSSSLKSFNQGVVADKKANNTLSITRKDTGKTKQKPALKAVLISMSKCSSSSCLMSKS